jgi:hypothetical protein
MGRRYRAPVAMLFVAANLILPENLFHPGNFAALLRVIPDQLPR